MKSIARFCMLWMLCLATLAHADDFSDSLKQLAQKSIVRAQFQQSKHLSHANKPMLSQGQLLFSRNQGIVWQLKRPVQADLIVTPRKMVQKTARTQSTVNLKQTPYGPAANVLLQLMAGNEQALRQHFKIADFQKRPHGWQAKLLPTSTDMKSLFHNIVIVSENGYINQLTLLDTQQKPTAITFTAHNNHPLTAADHALFQLAQ